MLQRTMQNTLETNEQIEGHKGRNRRYREGRNGNFRTKIYSQQRESPYGGADPQNRGDGGGGSVT